MKLVVGPDGMLSLYQTRSLKRPVWVVQTACSLYQARCIKRPVWVVQSTFTLCNVRRLGSWPRASSVWQLWPWSSDWELVEWLSQLWIMFSWQEVDQVVKSPLYVSAAGSWSSGHQLCMFQQQGVGRVVKSALYVSAAGSWLSGQVNFV